MSKKVLLKVLGVVLAVAFLTAACAPKGIKNPAFGLLMVGPYNDHGWSQAHYDAGLYVEEKVPGVKMVYLDKVNVADRPGTTPAQLGEELVSKGAKLVIFNSDDMKDSAHDFALANPNVYVIHASGAIGKMEKIIKIYPIWSTSWAEWNMAR
jgi:simple sugar transport system substrate-binding protein